MRHVAEIDVEAAEYEIRRRDGVRYAAQREAHEAHLAELREAFPPRDPAEVEAEEAAMAAAPCTASAAACAADNGEWACAPCRARMRAL